jgi:hypothetical protein
VLRAFLTRLASRLPPQAIQLEIEFSREEALLSRLRALGLTRIRRVVLTRNAAVMVSHRGPVLRMHEAFVDASDATLGAIVLFISGTSQQRRAARRAILDFPVPGTKRRARRRERDHPEDAPLRARLIAEHRRVNAERFEGTLAPVAIRVSRRLRSRLGHYATAATHGEAEIAISRRHIRRDGWSEAIETLIHEMIHQWQEESGLPVDHGASFRRKAQEVGVPARARRIVA